MLVVRYPMMLICVLVSILSLVRAYTSTESRQCESARYVVQPDVFILTDISNEPDDQMSLVRLLTYANELNIVGIAATTSTWLHSATDEPAIQGVIDGYEAVVDNLNANVPKYAQYPSAAELRAKVTTDFSIVTNEWLQQCIRIGELGAHYLNWTFIMEGDTPSFFPLIQNGLGDPEHPEWGSWGGRYVREDFSGQNNVYSNAPDFVVGENGDTFFSSFATIWRWRKAYQYDFAARMAWTVEADAGKTNHNPVAIVNESCGLGALNVTYEFGQTVRLNASESWDPDGDNLRFVWFHYRDPMQRLEGDISPVSQNVTIENVDEIGSVVAVTPRDKPTMHIILALEDERDLPLTSYRRIILQPMG